MAQKRAMSRIQLQNIPRNAGVREQAFLCNKREGIVLFRLDECAFSIVDRIRPRRRPTWGGEGRRSVRHQKRNSLLSCCFVYKVVEDFLRVVNSQLGDAFLLGLDDVIPTRWRTLRCEQCRGYIFGQEPCSKPNLPLRQRKRTCIPGQ
jgi:hypothetical protein